MRPSTSFALGLIAIGLMVFSPSAFADTRVISAPAKGSPEATVMAALKAGIEGDMEAYLKTLAPALRENEKQRAQIQRYSWKRFQKQASWYVKVKAPLTFTIARQDGKDGKRRLFLLDHKNADRMPVPVRLEQRKGRWWIVTNSL